MGILEWLLKDENNGGAIIWIKPDWIPSLRVDLLTLKMEWLTQAIIEEDVPYDR